MRFFLLVVIALQATLCMSQKSDSTFLKHVGETVTISGTIYSGAFLTNVKTKPTFFNLGDTNPNHRLMIRIEPEDRDKFPSPPEVYFLNKQVSVTGVVNNYKGTALIKVSQPEMMKTGDASVITPPAKVDVVKNTPPVVQLPAVPPKAEANKPSEKKLPDTIMQSAWVNGVANKTAEQIKKNMRVVVKEIPLHVSPGNEAPVIALLNPGIVISVLDKSRKWSHIIVRTVDGSNSVLGFIKNKSLRHLKRLQ